MDIIDGSVDLIIIAFYLLPVIILLFSKKINRQFRLVNIPVKVVDLLIPYMLILLFFLGRLYFEINLIPYIIIVLSLMGIVIATFRTFVKEELNLYFFFRIWWRYVFLILLTGYLTIGIIIAYQAFS
ncbi:DUF3397 family protein [Alkalibacterium pelagium]|uniref:DUF3397 domain-containing protein n=1 Tax=Alkalibacterium pelagium TaxID=426702 RepID=A0A1H7GZS5_9LACT|nr:DUF3397 family protein [Alkalibacterium pelagium]GEN49681.1 hypothetical protein APE02nite_03460 [Alkalibacterium pelagium]SEK42170.1 Protein of unknown function [Alkalibacterium pelagium]